MAPRRLTGSRETLAILILAMGAGVSAAVSAPLWVRAPLGFALTSFLPGYVLSRYLLVGWTAGPGERWAMALGLSFPLTVAARVAAGFLGLTGAMFVVTWAVLVSVGALLSRDPKPSSPPEKDRVWLLAPAFGLFVALPGLLNGNLRVWGDSMFHAQLTLESLFRGIPPEHPAFAGTPANYYYTIDLQIAAMVEAMGVSPYLAFVWNNGALMTALALAAHGIGRRLWPDRLSRNLSMPVALFGMNAVGWLVVAGFIALAPLVGEQRGWHELRQLCSEVFVNPRGGASVCLLPHAYFVMSTLLFKFFCANSVSAGIAMSGVSLAFSMAYLSGGGRGRAITAVVTAAAGILANPPVGVPAICGILGGLLLSLRDASQRRRAVGLGLGLLLGAALAAWVLTSILARILSGGDQSRVNFMTTNLIPLMQGLLVVAVPGVWGWRRGRHGASGPARLLAGFTVTTLVIALLADLPYSSDAYVVYLVCFAVSIFAVGGVGAAIVAGRRRGRRVLPWVVAALLFLPTPLIQFNGFLRHAGSKAEAGYPENADEMAIFDYLRDHTPITAVVLDNQLSYCPASAAYSGRQAFYPGRWTIEHMGDRDGLGARRERAMMNLFLASDVPDTTWGVLQEVGRPIYVVARRRPSNQVGTAPSSWTVIDPVEKLATLRDRLRPVVTTPTIVLYRLEGA